MRRRQLLKSSALLLVPLAPDLAPSGSGEPDPRLSWQFIHVEDVPDKAIVAEIEGGNLPDQELEELKESTQMLVDRPGESVKLGTTESDSEPLDYSSLPYSELDDGEDGYYVDMGIVVRISAR